jgi:colanic acid biosynthesis glycosyl transferase WcaI
VSKILFVNRSFGPDTDPTGVLLTELTEDLARDHEITVICGSANTAKLKLWPMLHRECHGEVKVIRTFGAGFSKRNLAFRLANLAVYWFPAWIAAGREHADVIIAETDPPLLGFLGAIVKRLKGCRFVYYCQDVYPDIAEATRGLRNRWLIAFLRWCNNFAYYHADAIVVLGADMAERLRCKGVPDHRIVIIPNWIDCRKVKPQPASGIFGIGQPGDFVVMYDGNFGWSQDLGTILEAAQLMRDHPRVKFVLVGDGCKKTSLERTAKLMGLPNVRFIDRHPPSAISEVLAEGHLQLIPLTAGAAGCLVPSKVYGILAAGKPFVAMMEPGAEVARLAVETGVGLVVPPGDAEALAATISRCMKNPELLDEMGQRARRLVEHSYDRRLVTRRFAEFLGEFLGTISHTQSTSQQSDLAKCPVAREIASVTPMPGD